MQFGRIIHGENYYMSLDLTSLGPGVLVLAKLVLANESLLIA